MPSADELLKRNGGVNALEGRAMTIYSKGMNRHWNCPKCYTLNKPTL